MNERILKFVVFPRPQNIKAHFAKFTFYVFCETESKTTYLNIINASSQAGRGILYHTVSCNYVVIFTCT